MAQELKVRSTTRAKKGKISYINKKWFKNPKLVLPLKMLQVQYKRDKTLKNIIYLLWFSGTISSSPFFQLFSFYISFTTTQMTKTWEVTMGASMRCNDNNKSSSFVRCNNTDKLWDAQRHVGDENQMGRQRGFTVSEKGMCLTWSGPQNRSGHWF